MKDNTCFDLGELTLLRDSKVLQYTGILIKNKRRKYSLSGGTLEQPFRLIIAQSKEDEKKQFWFIYNDFNLTAQEIAQVYRRRWDIEVFFRFIKQELSVSHLVSLNKNGIEVILYMTLIVAMLILIYKKVNDISYTTAKRRLAMEIRNLGIAMLVVQCGGDPNLMFKT